MALFPLISSPFPLVDEVKCIKKKGMPFYKDQMGHGNLYVKFKVEFPKKNELKPDQIEGLKKVKESLAAVAVTLLL